MSKAEKLHDAVGSGDLEAVRKALAPTLLTFRKVDVNEVVDGWTALQRAAVEGHKEIVELLVENGANLEAVNEAGLTALCQGYLKGHKEIVEQLVKKGAALTPTGAGWSPLHQASSEGDLQLVRLLVDHGADVNATNASGWTALLTAVGAGFEEIVLLLLDRGADVNAMADEDQNALLLATNCGRGEIVQLLLEHGADVNAVNRAGATALLCAAGDGFDEIVELLLGAGAEVNAASNQGTTPLIVAAKRGRTTTVELLIAAGANPNAATQNGWTALHNASMGGHMTIVKLLIENGADLNRPTRDGWTARRLAESARRGDIAELLPQNVEEQSTPTGARNAEPSQRGDGESLEQLFHKLRVPIPANQMEAVDGLVAAGPDVVPRLIQDLEDTYLTAGHRKAAAFALGRIGDKRADEPLMKLVKGYWASTPEEREVARKQQSLIPDEHRALATEARSALVALGHEFGPELGE